MRPVFGSAVSVGLVEVVLNLLQTLCLLYGQFSNPLGWPVRRADRSTDGAKAFPKQP